MTFIEMLQQGGYILPQYSSGQQTYSAPAAGMQTLQTMMQVDQGAQNRYLQGEQLNLYKSQNTQNIINSTIQNQLNRKTQERLQKQMDLSNQKLEFDMQKAILKDIDEEREKLNSSFLLRDRLQIEKELTDQGLDEAGIIAGMKGDLSFDNYSKFQLKRQSIIAKQKNGFTNMHTYNQASKLVEKTDAELKRAYELMNVGALDYNAFEKYLQNSKEAAIELIKFENGDVQNIDFKDSKWSGITGATDFLDEVQMQHNAKVEKQIKTAKMQEDLADAAYKTANAQMLTNTLDSRIKLNEAKAALDLAKANNEISDMEFDQSIRKLQDEEWNMWMQENPNAPVKERISARNEIYSDKGPDKSTSNYTSAEQMYTEGVRTQNQDLMDAAMDWKTADNNKTTVVDYRTDSAGKQGIVDKDGNVNYGGYWTTNKDGKDTWAGGIYGKKRIEAAYIESKLKDNIIQPQADGSIKLDMSDGDVLTFFGISPTSNWGFGNWNSDDIKQNIPNAKKEGNYWIIPPDDIGVPQTSGANNNNDPVPVKINSSTKSTTVPADAAKVL
jgi:hypothetical protein